MHTETLNTQVEYSDGTSSKSSLEYTQSDSAKVKTKGEVKSYKIIKTGQNRDGLSLVKVRAVVAKFIAGPTSNRKRVALFPTKSNRDSYKVFGIKTSTEVGDDLNRAVERHLVQSRKFAVLTRQDLDRVGLELNLISSEATPSSEKAKLGQLLGADVLLLPEIVKASAEVLSQKIKISGESIVSVVGNFDILMRIVDAVTGEIKFSERYSVDASDYYSLEPMVAKIAEIAVSDLVDRIYPIRLVSSLSGGEYVLNQGGSGVNQGELFDVFGRGKKIVDPYTNEPLGYSEKWLARIEVTRVSPKMSYARVIEGEITSLKAGITCRKHTETNQDYKPQPQSSHTSGKTTDVQFTPGDGGGVVLPFD
jgi:curli biogenesis system outer membrane secretion channel CsgG